MAFASVMAFAGGTDYVPGVTRGDTVPAMLTPGEGVVPGGVMDGLRTMARNGGLGGGQGQTVHVHVRPTYHVQALDGSGMSAVLEKAHNAARKALYEHAKEDESMKPTKTMTFTDGYGREVKREIRYTVDVEQFRGTAIYPWLMVAANAHLSSPDVNRVLEIEANADNCCYRSVKWLQARRRMYIKPDADNPINRGVQDGKEEATLAILRQYRASTMSAKDISQILSEHGIKRSRGWVRRHRCD